MRMGKERRSVDHSVRWSTLLLLLFTCSTAFPWNAVCQQQNFPCLDSLNSNCAREEIMIQDTSFYRPFLIAEDVSLQLIDWYQKSIAPSSIERCPFKVSCSNFAKQAIQQHGFIGGLCLFIDRNLYRENSEIYSQYEKIVLPSGVIKLDDTFYLSAP